MKITRIKNSITVVFEDGTMMTNTKCTNEMYEEILVNLEDQKAIKRLLAPNYQKSEEKLEKATQMLENYNKSEYLTVIENSMYVKSISDLSLPQDLAEAIWDAEQKDDLRLLSSYLNFWTLASLNKDPEARQNLFWFLSRYGMSISSSGLFVAYRNVQVHSEGKNISSVMAKFITESFTKIRHKHKKNPKNYYVGKDSEGEMICSASENKVVEVIGKLDDLYNNLSDPDTAPVYTDSYTGKFRIRIGEPVTMDRNKCDTNQNNTCSRGLHVAGKDWLQSNYFGNTGLRVLVNPSDVVAVPPQDSYGKMRVCAYYPVSVVDFDTDGKILDEKINDGFVDNFIDMISYVGEKNTEEVAKYSISLPPIPELSRNRIMDRLEDIKACLALKHKEGNV